MLVSMTKLTNMTTTPRLEKYALRMAQIQLARDAIESARGYYGRYQQYQAKKSSDNFYVVIEDGDDLFDRVQEMIFKEIPADEQRSVVAETQRNYSDDESSLLVYFDGDHPITLSVEGHSIRCEITTDKPPKQKRSGGDMAADSWAAELLKGSNAPDDQDSGPPGVAIGVNLSKRAIFTCPSVEARDAVIRKLGVMLSEMTESKPRFYVATSFGGWRSHSTVRARPLDSVVLTGTQKEDVVADLAEFLSWEARYTELGLPWHRGYLFEGPPGTGKTSLATALATHFRFNVYYINLSSVENDSRLMDSIASIEPGRSFLVLEDIDIVRAAKDRDDSEKGVTLGGLLNALDGIATPHGLITIMTSNFKSRLDPALIRAGRVDMSLHISYVTDDQLQRMCERFMGRRIEGLPRITGDITPADVVALFKGKNDETIDEDLRSLILEKNVQNSYVHSPETTV